MSSPIHSVSSKVMNRMLNRRKRATSSIVEHAQSNDVDKVRSLCKASKRKSLTDTDSEGRTGMIFSLIFFFFSFIFLIFFL